MRLLILPFLFTIIIIKPLFAYNGDRCYEKVIKKSVFFGLAFSTSSYVSSTGECSMLSSTKERKQQFIVFNLDELKLDSARGGGEYAEAYASLSGCSLNTNDAFSKALQHNFTQIYGTSTDHDVEAVYNSIEQVIRRDQMLSRECRVRGS